MEDVNRGTGKTERMLKEVAGREDDCVLVVGASDSHAGQLCERFAGMVDGTQVVRNEVRRPGGGVVKFIGMPDRPTPFLGLRLPIYVDHYVVEEQQHPLGVWDALDRANTARQPEPPDTGRGWRVEESQPKARVTGMTFTDGAERFRDNEDGAGNVHRVATGRYDAGEIVVSISTESRNPQEVPPAEIVKAVRRFLHHEVGACRICERPTDGVTICRYCDRMMGSGVLAESSLLVSNSQSPNKGHRCAVHVNPVEEDWGPMKLTEPVAVAWADDPGVATAVALRRADEKLRAEKARQPEPPDTGRG